MTKNYSRIKDADLESVDIDDDIDEDIDEENADDEERKVTGAKEILSEILSFSVYLLIVAVCTLLIVKFVGQRTVVYGESMYPMLNDHDNLIVDKISYRFNDPERFDIVVFPYEYEKGTYYIKRIIGLPGETVRIDSAGNIYINEVLLEEHYGVETILDPGIAYSGVTLGENEYFVMGDNRNHSSDSRSPAVGVVSGDKIIGKAWLRIYPFSSWGLVKHQ